MHLRSLKCSWVILATAALVALPALAQNEDQLEEQYGEPDELPAYAEDRNIDVQAFDDALTPYGEWVSTEPVGRVWHPFSAYVGVGFRPYVTGGHWIHTEFGWSFESDYPWGWAVFHYGRWAFVPAYGWVWLPGRVWAPAWVRWRYGGGFIGWAPLPPVGIVLSYAAYRPWCFLETQYFLNRNFAVYAVPPARFHAAYSVTAPFGAQYHYAGAAWYAGPPAAEISLHAGGPIPTARVVPPPPGTIHAAYVGSQAYVRPGPGYHGTFNSSAKPYASPGQHNGAPFNRSGPPAQRYAPPAGYAPSHSLPAPAQKYTPPPAYAPPRSSPPSIQHFSPGKQVSPPAQQNLPPGRGTPPGGFGPKSELTRPSLSPGWNSQGVATSRPAPAPYPSRIAQVPTGNRWSGGFSSSPAARPVPSVAQPMPSVPRPMPSVAQPMPSVPRPMPSVARPMPSAPAAPPMSSNFRSIPSGNAFGARASPSPAPQSGWKSAPPAHFSAGGATHYSGPQGGAALGHR